MNNTFVVIHETKTILFEAVPNHARNAQSQASFSKNSFWHSINTKYELDNVNNKSYKIPSESVEFLLSYQEIRYFP